MARLTRPSFTKSIRYLYDIYGQYFAASRLYESPVRGYCRQTSVSIIYDSAVSNHFVSFLSKRHYIKYSHKMSDETVNVKSVTVSSTDHGDEKTADVLDNTDEKKSGDSSKSTSDNQSQNLSKRALKRQARAQKFKDLKKKRRAENLALGGNDEAGYSIDEFNETSYYFENASSGPEVQRSEEKAEG